MKAALFVMEEPCIHERGPVRISLNAVDRCEIMRRRCVMETRHGTAPSRQSPTRGGPMDRLF